VENPVQLEEYNLEAYPVRPEDDLGAVKRGTKLARLVKRYSSHLHISSHYTVTHK
jgi:hypothetical protein